VGYDFSIPSMVVMVYKQEVLEVDLEGLEPAEDSWDPSSIYSGKFEGNRECNVHILHIMCKGNCFKGFYFSLFMVEQYYFPLGCFG
jgi:hypothetical protein